MKTILKATLLAAMALIVLATFGYFSAAQKPELTDEARFALKRFLAVDCEEEGEQGQSLNQMLAHKKALEPELIAVLRDGPDKQIMDETQRGLDEQWNVREAYLRKNPKLGLKESEMRIAQSLTRDSFISQGRAQVILKYREKSAIGLAAIGSPEALKALRESSQKGDEALQTVIKAALEIYGKKQ